MTYSIVARCPRTGEYGIGIATYSPNVGVRCPVVVPQRGAASMQAVKDAALDLAAMDTTRVGCCVGAAAGDFNTLEENHIEFLQRGAKAISPFCVPKVIPNMPAGNVAIALGIHGPNFAALSACATGAHSIGMAMLLLRTGQAERALSTLKPLTNANPPVTNHTGYRGYLTSSADVLGRAYALSAEYKF